VATLNNTSEETIVHMSWNGATAVASWRVLAATTPNALTSRAVVATTGFETATILPARYRYAAAQALDSAGRVLGTSATVTVKPFASALPSAGAAR
jgi:hypothetical protein